MLWLELDKRDVLLVEALVTHPLGVDLLGEEVEGGLRQARAHSVEPEVAARLAQDSLVVFVHLKKDNFCMFINYQRYVVQVVSIIRI